MRDRKGAKGGGVCVRMSTVIFPVQCTRMCQTKMYSSRPDEIEVIYSLLGGDKKHEMIIISLYVERYAYRK